MIQRIVFVWTVFIAVWSGVITLMVNVFAPAFIYGEYSGADFPSAGVLDTERYRLAVETARFLQADSLSAAAVLTTLVTPEGQPLYTEAEMSHLDDVKALTDIIVYIAWGSTTLLFLGVFFFRRNVHLIAQMMRQGALLTIVGSFVLIFMVVYLWNLFFTEFHEVLFPPGTWQFAGESGLILLFPAKFWFDFALTVVSFVSVVSYSLIGVAALLKRHFPYPIRLVNIVTE